MERGQGRRNMSFLSVFVYDLFSCAFGLVMAVCAGLFVLRILSFGRGKFRGLDEGETAMTIPDKQRSKNQKFYSV